MRAFFPSLPRLPSPCDKFLDERDGRLVAAAAVVRRNIAQTSAGSSKAHALGPLIVISASELHATLVLVLSPLPPVAHERRCASEETGVADEIAAGHVRPYFRRAARREMELFNKTIHLFLIYTLRSSLATDLLSRRALSRQPLSARISLAYLPRN